MKTETKSMSIIKTTEQPIKQPIILDGIPEDVVFLRSPEVCKLLSISNSTLRNLRATQSIPFYKLGGTFLYSKEEIMNYLASNYSRRI